MGDVHDVALTALFIDDETVVMQERDEHAPTSPNMFAFFGGAMELGESPEVAAARELREETTLVFEDNELRHMIDYPRPENNGTMHLFMLKISDDNFSVKEGRGKVVRRLVDVPLDTTADGSRLGAIYLYRLKEKGTS